MTVSLSPPSGDNNSYYLYPGNTYIYPGIRHDNGDDHGFGGHEYGGEHRFGGHQDSGNIGSGGNGFNGHQDTGNGFNGHRDKGNNKTADLGSVKPSLGTINEDDQ